MHGTYAVPLVLFSFMNSNIPGSGNNSLLYGLSSGSLLQVRGYLGFDVRYQEFRGSSVFVDQLLVFDLQRSLELTKVAGNTDSFFFYGYGLDEVVADVHQ